jgi:hypothetical protein
MAGTSPVCSAVHLHHCHTCSGVVEVGKVVFLGAGDHEESVGALGFTGGVTDDEQSLAGALTLPSCVWWAGPTGQRGIPLPCLVVGPPWAGSRPVSVKACFSFCFILFQKNASSCVACKIHNLSSRCPFEVVQLAISSVKCLVFKNIKLCKFCSRKWSLWFIHLCLY